MSNAARAAGGDRGRAVKTRHQDTAHVGTVTETVGRRVRVRDAEGERVCFLSGQRAVLGDRVRWVPARGEGGKLIEVLPRDNELARMDPRGRSQLLAANLGGLLVAVSAREPGFRRALVDRYLVAAWTANLDAAVVLTKVDLGVPDEVEAQLPELDALGVAILRVSASTGEGVAEVAAFLAARAEGGPWACVGGSGVGKTSLVAALLPGQDVGPIGEISEFWGTGRHTTTHSRLFGLPGGGEIADSPGIRNLTPYVDDPRAVRDHFPGVAGLACRYRDCLHREGEEGCVAEAEVPERVLASYRHLLNEVTGVLDGVQPGRPG
jgi:ribosome biogenesis GTPase